MKNNKFAQQISANNRLKPILTENLLVLNKKIIDKLSTELEMEKVIISMPMYRTVIKTDQADLEKLGFDEKYLGENIFFIWLIRTKYKAYLLIGTQIQFFKENDEPNLFVKDEKFTEFLEKIKLKLGLEHAIPYESDGGFYLFNSSIDSQEMSFFAYKI